MPRLILAISIGTALWLAGCNRQSAKETKLALPKVEVAKPLLVDAIDAVEFNGRLEASQTVEVRARVSGYLIKDSFPEGEEVKTGDLLFEIDPQTYQKTLDATQADLKAAEAQLKLADAEYGRARLLLSRSAVSPEEVDVRLGAQRVAAAAVTSAKAKVERAELDLQFTKIRSPISGRVSRKLVTIGNLISSTQDSILTTIVAQDPAHLYFSVDERTYLRVDRQSRSRPSNDNAKTSIPFLFRLEEERSFLHQGFVDFLENRFDSSTGTIAARGVVANPVAGNARRQFIPGMRARVKIETDAPYRALVVQEEAVQSDLRRRFVWIIREGKAERVEVKLGETVAPGMRDVVEGIDREDLVVVRGVQSLRPGLPVEFVKVNMPGNRDGLKVVLQP